MLSVIGGVIIGVAASVMLYFNGKVLGISGILGGVLNPQLPEKSWRFMFIAGLLIGGIILKLIYPEAFSLQSNASPWDYVIAGLFVGFGTQLGSGCTSGHGVCGISRLSKRSILATTIFILSGMVSVLLFKLIRGEL